MEKSQKRGMFIAQHLRALSVEYCRKRFVADFYKNIANITGNREFREYANHVEFLNACFKKIYIENVFNLLITDVDKLDYFCIPFSRNLQVSCCGCFDAEPGAFNSIIAFNLISYRENSILVLTIFNAVKHYLDVYIKQYGKDIEQMVNDIAFFHCEEPIIGANFWRSLDETQKLSVRQSIRHPSFRTEQAAPRIIKIGPNNLFSLQTPLSSVLAPLPPEMKNVEDLVKMYLSDQNPPQDYPPTGP